MTFVADICRAALVDLDALINRPGLPADARAILHVHRVLVQDALHQLGVSI